MPHSSVSTSTLRPLGSTGLQVSPLTAGTSGLGNRERTTEEAAAATIKAVVSSPVRVIDTSNEYGDGHSERRIGEALAGEAGASEILVVTKVDPIKGGPFDGDRVRASVAESLERLRTDFLPLVHFHDPERMAFEDAMAPGGPVEALQQLRDEGVIGAIGVAGGPTVLLEQFIRTDLFTSLVAHNRYTVLDRSADDLLNLCAERNVGVFNAAPFGGGVLAGGSSSNYGYRPMTPEHERAFAAITALCEEASVPLGAASLQWAVREPRIASTIVGVRSPEQLAEVIAWSEVAIADDLLDALSDLAADRSVWITTQGR